MIALSVTLAYLLGVTCLWGLCAVHAASERRLREPYVAHTYGGLVDTPRGVCIACPGCQRLLDWNDWFNACPGLSLARRASAEPPR